MRQDEKVIFNKEEIFNDIFNDFELQKKEENVKNFDKPEEENDMEEDSDKDKSEEEKMEII